MEKQGGYTHLPVFLSNLLVGQLSVLLQAVIICPPVTPQVELYPVAEPDANVPLLSAQHGNEGPVTPPVGIVTVRLMMYCGTMSIVTELLNVFCCAAIVLFVPASVP
jgi:hypothetical protein